MAGWIEGSGIDWLLGEAAPDADGAGLVVVLGRGLADQTIAGTGVAAEAAQVLHRELARPSEVPGVGVLEAQVHVSCDLLHTLVVLQGRPQAVAAAAARLERLLLDPVGIDEPEPVVTTGHPFPRWGRELAVLLGAGPATLSADLPPAGQGSTDRLTAWLRAMHPDAGTPVLGAVTHESLVGCCFAGSATRLRPPRLTWRKRRPGSLETTQVDHLLATRAPATVAGGIAVRLLAATLDRALLLSGSGQRDVGWIESRIGEGRAVAVGTNQPVGDDDDGLPQRDLVAGALETYLGLASEVVADAIAVEQTPGRVDVLTGPVRTAVESLAAGRLLDPEDVRRSVAAIGVESVRDAMGQVADSVVLCVPPGAEPPESYPLLTRDDPPPARPTPSTGQGVVATGSSRHRARGSMQGEHRPEYLTVLRDGPSLRLRYAPSRRARLGVREEPFDLDRLVARIDHLSSYSVLVDDADRRITLPWSLLRGAASLRQVVEAATPPEGALRIEADGGFSQTLDRRRRRVRKVLIGAAAVLVLVVAGVLWATLATRGDLRQPAVITEVATGRTATLPNGSRATVSAPRVTRVAVGSAGPTDVLELSLRFCGGGPTMKGGTDTAARNYLRPSSFALEGTPNGGPVTGASGYLGDTELAQGECLTATLGFTVPKDLPSAGMAVRYTNAVGDQITWRPVTLDG
ncbi:hypothetical protein BN12_780002 [Nostocoides japonicum T1-X7]|uniref:Uncharacterized protein n=1 Tax=Nostocoides japonicum T1-X7 TaxID=1194083 RepID=A0A077M1F5_9MICO|nr:hypothetical protein [Tetrasphaera japonica]CCH80153.1 hypothetical protein BN12_780002 [Tetrasphaera japonica T1-X7]